MKIQAREYLQIGYNPELFESVYWEGNKRIRKTAVCPNPQVNKYWKPKGDMGGQLHHIYLEPFLEFASYIPNKYDVIHFLEEPTQFELIKAKQLLSKDGEILIEKQ